MVTQDLIRLPSLPSSTQTLHKAMRGNSAAALEEDGGGVVLLLLRYENMLWEVPWPILSAFPLFF